MGPKLLFYFVELCLLLFCSLTEKLIHSVPLIVSNKSPRQDHVIHDTLVLIFV